MTSRSRRYRNPKWGPTDAVIGVPHAAIRDSDLRSHGGESDHEEGSRVGHEPTGIVGKWAKTSRRVPRSLADFHEDRRLE